MKYCSRVAVLLKTVFGISVVARFGWGVARIGERRRAVVIRMFIMVDEK